ncbi:MAG: hypothetical protein WCR31_02955 [Treponema sp.]
MVLLVFSFVLMQVDALGRRDVFEQAVGEPTEVSDMFFEVLRYDVTGVSVFPDIEKYAGVSVYPSKILLHIIWLENECPVYLIEKAVPSYTGKIDSTFDADSFLKVEKYDWVDDIVDESASEKAGKEIETLEMQPPEEIIQAEQGKSGTEQEKSIAASEESPSERRYRDAEGRLRLFSYGTEFFSVTGSPDNRILVSAEGKTMSRKYYDSLMRLAKKETWSMTDTSAQSSVQRTDVYYYNNDEALPFASVTQLSDKRIESLYNEKGLIYSQTDYSVDENNNKKIESRTLRKYNEKNKITEESYTRFLYSADKEMVQTGSTTRTDVYQYKNSGRTPDYFYYDDGTLRMKTVYTDNDTYTTTLYFNHDFTVITEYRHGRKSSETYIQGNRIMRSRTYDK